MKESKINEVAYLHFSFRKPANTDYIIMACVLTGDLECKRIVTKEVVTEKAGNINQHDLAIKSYINALRFLYKHQKVLKDNNVGNILLVTKNSSLYKWITETSNNKAQEKAVSSLSRHYKYGNKKGIYLGVGIMKPQLKDYAKKYCVEKLSCNHDQLEEELKNYSKNKVYAMDLHPSNMIPITSIINSGVESSGATEV